MAPQSRASLQATTRKAFGLGGSRSPRSLGTLARNSAARFGAKAICPPFGASSLPAEMKLQTGTFSFSGRSGGKRGVRCVAFWVLFPSFSSASQRAITRALKGRPRRLGSA